MAESTNNQNNLNNPSSGATAAPASPPKSPEVSSAELSAMPDKTATSTPKSPTPKPTPTGPPPSSNNKPPAPAEEDHHYELNALAWVLILVIAAAAVWFFVFSDGFNFGGDTEKGDGISQEVLMARIAISEGNLGETPFTNLSNAFSLSNLPLPSDNTDDTVSLVVVDTNSEEYDIARLEYLSSKRIAEAEEHYRDWATRRGYEALERNITEGSNVVVMDILDGLESVITVAISPSGRSSSKISIAFPLPDDTPGAAVE